MPTTRRNVLVSGAAALALFERPAFASQDKRSSALEAAKRHYIDFGLGENQATVDFNLAGGRRLQLKVQEGAMNLLAFDTDEPLRFVVDRSPAGSHWRLRTIAFSEVIRNSRRVPTLQVQPPVNWGSTDPELLRLGVQQVNLVTVAPLGFGRRSAEQSSICPELPCDGGSWLCCVFVGCDGRLVRVCTRGTCVSGGDGCGFCEICS